MANPKLFNTIKVYRAQHNMSQSDLAQAIGVRRETVGSLENGKYNPSLLLVIAIANVFHVTVEDLFPHALSGVEESKQDQ
jgi:putative transcriptional regulator